ncbi:MAG TPA: hypothetical protein VNX68_01060 [Nitrosopumilaceae archaeon]|jgi:hypothetical protein|nr:hypothetical protein [Nitrosopumilaceae archaeon]
MPNPPPKETIKSIQLTVSYSTSTNNGSNEFRNIQELKIWLDKHPNFAEALGYVKKKK